jgi:muramidase (phage lysozyme)
MGGSVIVQQPDGKKAKDSDIEKTLPPVTVTAEPEPRKEKEPEPRREPKPEAPRPEAPAPAPKSDTEQPGAETGKKTSDYEFQYRPGYTGRPFKEQALAEKYFNYKHQILSEQKLKLDQEQLEQLRRDPNVRRMLDLISRAEGADYDTIVGHPGKNAKIKIKDFSTHPQYVGLRTKYGPSDAAGRYQILSSTYRGQAKKLGIKDFSPESQDKIAISILNDVGALAPAMQGDFKKAIVRSNNQWVSLPGTKYEQGYGPRGWKWVEKTLKDLGADDTALASVTGKSTTTAGTEPKKQESKPQYYAIGDSQAQGVAGYGGDQWNKSMAYRGASILNPKQFEKHLANIEKIPPGSVVAISGGGNDVNSAKPEVITNQVNKLIAAAKARGLQVIHLLPTTTDDPRTKQSREQLRQAMVQGQTLAPIVDLGIASKKDPMNLHLDRKGYATIAKNIEDMLPIASATAGELPKDSAKKEIKGYPTGTQVQPDWSKYKYGDRGPLIKNARGEWTTLDGKSTATDPALIADLEKLPTNIDVKAAAPVTTKKDKEESWFEKLYGTKKAKEVQDQLAADTARREEERKKSDVKPKTVQSVSGTIDYSKVPAAAEQPAVIKSAAPKIKEPEAERPAAPAPRTPAAPKVELQRDQAGLVKAKRELSDFERAFAAARAEQGPGGEFTWTDPRTGKTGTYGTLYKGEKPPKTVSAVPVDQALSKGEELVNIPVTQATNRFQSSTSAPSTPAKSEIQQAIRAFDRKQDIERVTKQFDEPVSTPAPRTPEELASDELWKDIRASTAGKSPEEISAAAQRAKQELDAAIATDRTADATVTNSFRGPIELPDIELKEPTGAYNPPIDVPINSEEQIRRQAAKDATQDEMKESINNKSSAELHDILRLAGRLK